VTLRGWSVVAAKGLLLTLLTVTGSEVLLPVTADAEPPWGACGVNADPAKLVRAFPVKPGVDFFLRCGGPTYSPTPASGFRHILWRHRNDFERIAEGTYQNWRDVADLSMEFIARDPDVTVQTARGTTCYSRVIFLINIRTNQVVRQQIVRMVVVPGTSSIVTAYPADRHCRAGDPSA
jgi:hypothetical protein